ncbi:hypothetical protein CPAV1605_908 [seawater metagenome]|uniref:TLC domain-containing protein n=1 Tax=seawater metagenome TaxID=1561972 RepID=A0A5E8CIG9_9ZZZZ
MKIYYKIVFFIGFYVLINNKKVETSFSLYRSVCCLFIFIYALQNFLLYGKEGLGNAFKFSNNDITDLSKWFEAYIIVDLMIMTYIKCKRKDLWIHHILSLITVLIANYHSKKVPFILSIVLLSEAMSIMSGVDSIYTDENDLLNSMYCKKIRKNIINLWRTPLWIMTLILGILNCKKKGITPKVAIGGSIALLVLDRFWLKKCQKVIDKYNED